MRGGLAEVPAAECRRTAGSRHSAAGGQAVAFGVGKPPAPDESKAEHILAEAPTRGLAGRLAEGTRPKNIQNSCAYTSQTYTKPGNFSLCL